MDVMEYLLQELREHLHCKRIYYNFTMTSNTIIIHICRYEILKLFQFKFFKLPPMMKGVNKICLHVITLCEYVHSQNIAL